MFFICISSNYIFDINLIPFQFFFYSTISNITEDAFPEGNITLSNDEDSLINPPEIEIVENESRPSTSSSYYERRRRKNNDSGEISKAVDSFNNLLQNIRTRYSSQDESPIMLFMKNLAKKIGNRFSADEELEIQQALIEAF